MELTRIQLENLLNRIRTGATDLAPAEIDALAKYLNATPAAAARLAEQTPRLGLNPAVELPSPSEWERVWSEIDQALPDAPPLTLLRAPELASRERIAQLLGDETPAGRSRWKWTALSFPGLLAAAACILIVLALRHSPSEPDDSWPLQLGNSVEITDIEAPSDAAPVLIPLGAGNSIVLWNFDDDGA